MTIALTHATEPRFSFSVPASVPTSWRKDVSSIETLLERLRAKHSERELATLLVLAATRSLSPAKRPLSGTAAAMLRGVLARENLKNEEGGSVSAEEARSFLDITKTAVLDRYKQGKLLGWRENRQNAVRFPVWQFNATGGLLPGLEEVLAILRASPAVDDWGAILFFLNKRASLNQERPLDVLRRGDVEAVKQAAQGYVE